MKYEVKQTIIMHDGRVIDNSYLTNEITLAKCEGQTSLRIQLEGRKKGKLIPIEYTTFDLGRYTKSYEVIVCDASTGRRIERYTNITT